MTKKLMMQHILTPNIYRVQLLSMWLYIYLPFVKILLHMYDQ